MEMNENKNGCGENKSGCGGCGGCGYHHKHMMKWLVKIVLAVLIFSFGYQIGEMKGMLRSQFGGYRHGGFAMPMMYGEYWGDTQVGAEGGNVGLQAPQGPATK